MPLTPEQRTKRARMAAHAMHAKHAPSDLAAKVKSTLLKRFEEQVDPDRTLPEAERARRAEHARKAHYARLSLRSSQARAARRTG